MKIMTLADRVDCLSIELTRALEYTALTESQSCPG